MLTYNETIKIFQSYSELEEKVSGNRHRFIVTNSLQRGRELAREMMCNQDGSYNGYISAKYMSANIRRKYAHITDSRQMISIKELTAVQLNEAIQDGIQSMICETEEAVEVASLKANQEEKHYTPFAKMQTDSSIDKLVPSCLYNWLGYGNPNKQLGRTVGNHYLCELFQLPKTKKSSIEPYEKIWSSVKNYHDVVLKKRFELIKSTIIDNPQVQIIISYEKGLLELVKQNLSSSLEQLSVWEYGKQQYSLFQLKLDTERRVLLLSTPFFGQGQISYEGIKACVRHVNSFLSK